MSRATLRAPPAKWAMKGFFPAGERSELSRREAWPQWGLGRSPKRPAGRVGGEQSDRQGAMRHRTPRARGQPLRAVCPRNVVRLFRPLGRNWTTRIYSGRPTVRFPQTEATAHSDVGRLWSRRAAGFLLHAFLSPSKEKCERPMGRQVPLPRRSRRVRPLDRKLLPAELSCNAACRGAFRSPPAPLRFAWQSKTVPHRVAPVKLLYTVTSRGISTIKRMNKGTFRSPIKKRNARKTISPQYPRRTNRIIPSAAALKPHHAAENCGHT